LVTEIEVNVTERCLLVSALICCIGRGKAPITFILDTGAEVTSLSESDLNKMGLSTSDLPHSSKTMMGISGKPGQTFEMDNAVLLFQCSNKPGKAYEHHIDTIQVLQKQEIKDQHKTKNGAKIVIHRESKIPSLLGFDFFKQTNATLTIDFKNISGKIIIED